MTPKILLTFGLLVVAVALFVTEFIRYDLVALGVMAALMITGLADVQTGLSGLANEAVVTIACLLVLSEGLKRCGALDLFRRLLEWLTKRSPRLLEPVLLGVAGVLSAFMNNTAVVAILIPVATEAGRMKDESPSKLLMPLSFIAIFGGICTLIGTSTNLLVSSIIQDHGLEPFGMFEFTPVGVLLMLVGGAWLLILGPRLLPDRGGDDSLSERFKAHRYLADVEVRAGFPGMGDDPEASPPLAEQGVEVVQVFRQGDPQRRSDPSTRFEPGDVVRLQGSPAALARVVDQVRGLDPAAAEELEDADLEVGEDVLVEAVLAPNAPLSGELLGDVDLAERFDAVAIALRQRDALVDHALPGHRLGAGDSLLLKIRGDRVHALRDDPNFVVVSSIERPSTRTQRLPFAAAILVAVVGTAALDMAPIVVTALAGVVAMILSGCLTAEEATQAVDWKIVFLLAGLIPLGEVMESTGAATWLADNTLSLVGGYGLHATVAALFGLTMLLTNVVSNAASAVLLAPLALSAAQRTGLDPRPLLVAVTFGASLSFMTPIGYQTNTLVYGPGRYRFRDFFSFGAPLNLLMWGLVTLLIPLFWGT